MISKKISSFRIYWFFLLRKKKQWFKCQEVCDKKKINKIPDTCKIFYWWPTSQTMQTKFLSIFINTATLWICHKKWETGYFRTTCHYCHSYVHMSKMSRVLNSFAFVCNLCWSGLLNALFARACFAFSKVFVADLIPCNGRFLRVRWKLLIEFFYIPLAYSSSYLVIHAIPKAKIICSIV